MIDMRVLERALDLAHEEIAKGYDPHNSTAGLLESVEEALGIQQCARCVTAGEAGDATQAARGKAVAW